MSEIENLDLVNQNTGPVTRGPANGTLLIHGGVPEGAHIDDEFRQLFRRLAGGPDATLVYIPSAAKDEEIGPTPASRQNVRQIANYFGFNDDDVSVMHTRDRRVADGESFVKPLLEANAVFFNGGRQWRLAKTYLNTQTHQELWNVLDRGGIIAGSSAGATIMGSFLVRGDSIKDDNTKFIGNYQEGFGFIRNVAIDQHVIQLGRQDHIFEVLKKHHNLLGIGIDEQTSIYVQGDEFSVFGDDKSVVIVSDWGKPQICLRDRDRYNRALRQVIPRS